MKNIVNVIEGVVGITAGAYFIMYLTGKLNYSGEKEEKRIQRVKKLGWLLWPCAVLAIIFSTILILS